MLEPLEKHDQEHGKVKLDREVLSSMMKSWLMPRSTSPLQSQMDNDATEKDAFAYLESLKDNDAKLPGKQL